MQIPEIYTLSKFQPWVYTLRQLLKFCNTTPKVNQIYAVIVSLVVLAFLVFSLENNPRKFPFPDIFV